MSIIISDINTSGRSFQKNFPDDKINLKNGEIIRGTVVGKLPEGGTLLSANGRPFNVLASPDLPEGSRHLFQVNLSGSKIELKLLDGAVLKSDQPAAVMTSNAARETLTGILSELNTALEQGGLGKLSAQAINNLRQIMSSIVYSNPRDHNGAWIKENIMASGLFWENKVVEFLSNEKNDPIKKIIKGDLKAILLALQKALLAEDNDSNDALTMKVRQALNLIEGNQMLNLSSLEEGLGWLFLVPGLQNDGFRKAEIFAKKGDGRAGISFSVLLDFTKLGRFEANVSMTGPKTSVRILTDDPEKAGIVNDNLHLLEKGLRALGMKDLNISCDVRKPTDMPGGLAPDFAGRSPSVNLII